MGFIYQNEFGPKIKVSMSLQTKDIFHACFIYLPNCHGCIFQKWEKTFAINEQILPQPVGPNGVENEVVRI